MLNLVKLTEYTHEISKFINVVRTVVYTGIIQFYQDHNIILNINIEYFHIITTYSTQPFYTCMPRFILTIYMLRYFMLYTYT